jgi:hypothetical protein
MSDYDEIRNDPEFIEWETHVRKNVIPKMKGSAITVSLAPRGEPDIKYAVELGLSIMMNKPIIIVCEPYQDLSKKLKQVADKIIEVDWRNDPEGGQTAIADGISEYLEMMDLFEGEPDV